MRIVQTSSKQKDQILAAIDAMADALRTRVVVDPVRVSEYDLARIEAQRFADAGYVGDVPATVLSWAQAKGWTTQQAADDILTTAAKWYAALYGIRDARLKAKEAVRSAATWAAVQECYAQYEMQLQALASQLG